MKKFILLSAIQVCSIPMIAQTINVHVVLQNNQPAQSATISLHHASDSVLVRFEAANEMGETTFDHLGPGEYFIAATHAGYQKAHSAPFFLRDTIETITIKMEPEVASQKLQGVTVVSAKPYLQKLADRMVVNVDNSIVNAGSTALEILERSPGVMLDQNDQLRMRGKQGVIVYIDGKPSPLSGNELINYLRSLPANTIERIELITNPSARYDAAGNAGIIDIRMKKDRKHGLNGTVNAGYGQGVYPKANAGINFNYRNAKMNLFASHNYAYREGMNHLTFVQSFYENKQFTGSVEKDNYLTMPVQGHNFRAGADFYLNKSTTLGFVTQTSLTDLKRKTTNDNIVNGTDHLPASTFYTFTKGDDDYSNNLFNLNLRKQLKQKGRELSVDLDYGRFSSLSNSLTHTRYYNLNGSQLHPDYILEGMQDGNLTFYTGRIDYTHPLNETASFETGLKASKVSSNNDARFFDNSNGTPIPDLTKTNHFLYTEYNFAAYATYKKAWKKFSAQLGIRAEQTEMDTYQAAGDIFWDSSYLKVFPSAFLQYKLAENNVLGLSVSRRIDRPNYSQLNPFLYLIDVTTYATGNPGLLPQLTWSYELSYLYKKLNLSLNYSRSTQNQNIALARFNDVFPDLPQNENVTVQIPINLASSDFAALSASLPVKVNGWWNMVNNGDVFYNHFNGQLGETVLNDGKPGYSVRTNHTFQLGKGWSAEWNGFLHSGGQYGFMVSDPQWAMGMGVQKLTRNKKGILRLNVTDMFWTNIPRGLVTYDNYVESWKSKRETRIVNFSFTYRFGKTTVPATRQRATGSEEERRRASQG